MNYFNSHTENTHIKMSDKPSKMEDKSTIARKQNNQFNYCSVSHNNLNGNSQDASLVCTSLQEPNKDTRNLFKSRCDPQTLETINRNCNVISNSDPISKINEYINNTNENYTASNEDFLSKYLPLHNDKYVKYSDSGTSCLTGKENISCQQKCVAINPDNSLPGQSLDSTPLGQNPQEEDHHNPHICNSNASNKDYQKNSSSPMESINNNTLAESITNDEILKLETSIARRYDELHNKISLLTDQNYDTETLIAADILPRKQSENTNDNSAKCKRLNSNQQIQGKTFTCNKYVNETNINYTIHSDNPDEAYLISNQNSASQFLKQSGLIKWFQRTFRIDESGRHDETKCNVIPNTNYVSNLFSKHNNPELNIYSTNYMNRPMENGLRRINRMCPQNTSWMPNCKPCDFDSNNTGSNMKYTNVSNSNHNFDFNVNPLPSTSSTSIFYCEPKAQRSSGDSQNQYLPRSYTDSNSEGRRNYINSYIQSLEYKRHADNYNECTDLDLVPQLLRKSSLEKSTYSSSQSKQKKKSKEDKAANSDVHYNNKDNVLRVIGGGCDCAQDPQACICEHSEECDNSNCPTAPEKQSINSLANKQISLLLKNTVIVVDQDKPVTKSVGSSTETSNSTFGNGTNILNGQEEEVKMSPLCSFEGIKEIGSIIKKSFTGNNNNNHRDIPEPQQSKKLDEILYDVSDQRLATQELYEMWRDVMTRFSELTRKLKEIRDEVNELGSIVHGNRDREISDLKLPDYSPKHALQSKSSFYWKYKLERDSLQSYKMPILKGLDNENVNIDKDNPSGIRFKRKVEKAIFYDNDNIDFTDDEKLQTESSDDLSSEEDSLGNNTILIKADSNDEILSVGDIFKSLISPVPSEDSVQDLKINKTEEKPLSTVLKTIITESENKKNTKLDESSSDDSQTSKDKKVNISSDTTLSTITLSSDSSESDIPSTKSVETLKERKTETKRQSTAIFTLKERKRSSILSKESMKSESLIIQGTSKDYELKTPTVRTNSIISTNDSLEDSTDEADDQDNMEMTEIFNQPSKFQEQENTIHEEVEKKKTSEIFSKPKAKHDMEKCFCKYIDYRFIETNEEGMKIGEFCSKRGKKMKEYKINDFSKHKNQHCDHCHINCQCEPDRDNIESNNLIDSNDSGEYSAHNTASKNDHRTTNHNLVYLHSEVHDLNKPLNTFSKYLRKQNMWTSNESYLKQRLNLPDLKDKQDKIFSNPLIYRTETSRNNNKNITLPLPFDTQSLHRVKNIIDFPYYSKANDMFLCLRIDTKKFSENNISQYKNFNTDIHQLGLIYNVQKSENEENNTVYYAQDFKTHSEDDLLELKQNLTMLTNYLNYREVDDISSKNGKTISSPLINSLVHQNQENKLNKNKSRVKIPLKDLSLCSSQSIQIDLASNYDENSIFLLNNKLSFNRENGEYILQLPKENKSIINKSNENEIEDNDIPLEYDKAHADSMATSYCLTEMSSRKCFSYNTFTYKPVFNKSNKNLSYLSSSSSSFIDDYSERMSHGKELEAINSRMNTFILFETKVSAIQTEDICSAASSLNSVMQINDTSKKINKTPEVSVKQNSQSVLKDFRYYLFRKDSNKHINRKLSNYNFIKNKNTHETYRTKEKISTTELQNKQFSQKNDGNLSRKTTDQKNVNKSNIGTISKTSRLNSDKKRETVAIKHKNNKTKQKHKEMSFNNPKRRFFGLFSSGKKANVSQNKISDLINFSENKSKSSLKRSAMFCSDTNKPWNSLKNCFQCSKKLK